MGVEALAGKVTAPAWKSKPTYYLVASDDHMIPPPAQRQMAQRAGARVARCPAAHAVDVSHPEEVAEVVEQAALAPVESQ